MKPRPIALIATALVSALVVAACGSNNKTTTTGGAATSATTTSSGGSSSSSGSGTINGAGSTLAAPIYQQWGSVLKGQGLTVNFNPVGSGAGLTSLEAATVNFAGSDPALKASDKAKMKGAVLQFPVAAGAITLSYNLSGVKSGIKLDGATVSKIFQGTIKTWNDPAIKALNPGMSLPSTSITVVHRSDSSGTTAGFTTWLSDVDPTWKSSVGEGKDVKWPTGTGAKGNSGVAAVVHQTSGAIGYVEQAYAVENGFTYAAIKNSGGSYVLPTIPNTSAAFLGIKIPADLGISTVNSPNPGAYPIVSQTFIDAYKDPCKDGGASSGTAGALKKFLTYAFGAGQQTLGAGSNQLPYAPVPSALADKDNTQLATMVCNGSAIS
ncbi:MAG TPA: phosphate ABC transporter substrate-binding protein PstS [Solirubrobacteraceae bacterium]